MKQTFKNNLSHNNSGYGYGKFWVAKLSGKDKKWGFKREFGAKPFVDYQNNSKTTWYNFETEIEIGEGEYMEFFESNAYKSRRQYFVLKDNELVEINKSDIKFN